MVEERLPEVNPPSVRVPGRGLLALPILVARRQRNRGEIAKRVLSSEVSCHGEYIGEGGSQGGPPGVQAAPWSGPTLGRARRALGTLVGPLWPLLGVSGSFRYA